MRVFFAGAADEAGAKPVPSAVLSGPLTAEEPPGGAGAVEEADTRLGPVQSPGPGVEAAAAAERTDWVSGRSGFGPRALMRRFTVAMTGFLAPGRVATQTCTIPELAPWRADSLVGSSSFGQALAISEPIACGTQAHAREHIRDFDRPNNDNNVRMAAMVAFTTERGDPKWVLVDLTI